MVQRAVRVIAVCRRSSVCAETERAFLFPAVQLLENLVVAMESEAQVIDISRVSGFMQKVRSTASIVMAGVLNVLLQVRNGVI